MLVARAITHDHEELLILGLSAENRHRLAEGRPIELRVGQTLGPLKIVIFAGETEDTMQAELAPLIGVHTTVIHRNRSEGQ